MTMYAVALGLLALAVSVSAECAWAQTMDEVNIERKLRDLEQLVNTRLAGNQARGRVLTEQAQQAIRDWEEDPSSRPECKKLSVPTEVDVLSDEVNSALKTTASRLRGDDQAYQDRLREYEVYKPSDARKIDMYYALKLQLVNLLELRSKGRNIAAISGSWSRVLVEVTPKVVTAACFTRDQSLSAALLRLTRDYRELLYGVQR